MYTHSNLEKEGAILCLEIFNVTLHCITYTQQNAQTIQTTVTSQLQTHTSRSQSCEAPI